MTNFLLYLGWTTLIGTVLGSWLTILIFGHPFFQVLMVAVALVYGFAMLASRTS